MSEALAGLRIKVRGIVQGVGFRPFIYGLASQYHLTGWVRNTSAGVEIEVNGEPQDLHLFVEGIKNHPPPLARIDWLDAQEVTPDHYQRFEIIESQPHPGDFIPVSPDVAICADCRRELFTPGDRRYRYPFINCTNCGPRFTIIKDVPYDRPMTTMAVFTMCADCSREYHDPLDRRFHAQPVACPRCGPQIWFEAVGSRLADGEDALALARQWLCEGKVVAVKGLGGYHLACDASNPQAVELLRTRKKRSDKPFALMAPDLETIERYCVVSDLEKSLLSDAKAPILLLERKPGAPLAPQVAINQRAYGFMLPYTPLHLLLMEKAPGFPDVLVMTSANLAEEPIAYLDTDARERLSTLADGFLLHSREIYMRTDDSVLRTARGQTYPIRRARGYAPDPIRLSVPVKRVFAAGAELKNVFCLTRDNYAFLSHHIGDLENYESLRSYESGIAHFERLFRIQPEILACDLHPDYLATRYALARAESENLPVFQVQHHHAHLAACLADNGWPTGEPAIGVCLDGTGYGTDGAIWGGEFLIGGFKGFQRFAHLKYVPLPGGDAAVRKCSRMALAHLWAAGIPWEPDLIPLAEFSRQEAEVLLHQLEKGLNAPPTSSMGRLFDAVSALIGVRQTATYEGQAAIELENCVDPHESGWYTFEFHDGEIDPAKLWREILTDLRASTPASVISARFHNSVARLVLDVCQAITAATAISTVCLSGGVWQNMTLFNKTVPLLEKAGYTVLTHRQVPANDGGIALGQAVIASYAAE
jgi:hydrogenase maturation protein HypF